MNNVTHIHGGRLVAMLEKCLEDAKSGKLEHVAIAGLMANDQYFTYWSEHDSTLEMIGLVDVLRGSLRECYFGE